MSNMLNYNDPVLLAFITEYYDMSKMCYKIALDDAYYRRYCGESNPLIKQSLTGNDLSNNFNYLLSMLVIAYFEYAKHGFTPTLVEEFYDEYKIDCVKKNFLCWGCDITPIINRFTAISNTSRTGIGFMIVEETFIINKN